MTKNKTISFSTVTMTTKILDPKKLHTTEHKYDTCWGDPFDTTLRRKKISENLHQTDLQFRKFSGTSIERASTRDSEEERTKNLEKKKKKRNED